MKKVVMFFLCLLILILPSQVFAQRKVPILIYHSIDEFTGQGSNELYVTPDNFQKQMIYLKDHGYTLLTIDRWQEIHKENKPIFIIFYKNCILNH
ncbi:hypothetical protein ABEY24_21180 [Peribacillus frigoritolerans]